MQTKISKTPFLKEGEIKKEWYLIDAKEQIVGRLASNIVTILRGKHKSTYTPNMDCGDNIVVINAGAVKFSGNKLQDKTYYYHTGYPGGVKSRKAIDLLTGKVPQKVLYDAVRRMLPKTTLARKQLKNLKLFVDNKHTHHAQKPKPITIDPKKLNFTSIISVANGDAHDPNVPDTKKE